MRKADRSRRLVFRPRIPTRDQEELLPFRPGDHVRIVHADRSGYVVRADDVRRRYVYGED